jgi:hypothetical protein
MSTSFQFPDYSPFMFRFQSYLMLNINPAVETAALNNTKAIK